MKTSTHLAPKRYFLSFIFIFTLNLFMPFGASASVLAQTVDPRYAPDIVSIVRSHEYIRTHQALMYWKLSPYYLPQRNPSSCSLATVTMIVNAARSDQVQAVSEPLATQDGLLSKVSDNQWSEGVKMDGDGISLNNLSLYLPKALEAYGLHNFTIEVVHTEDTSEATAAKLNQALKDMENGHTFMIANYDQGVVSGDSNVGHFAPIGAYDAEAKRVLIMDPDREWFEPYWVPENIFLKGLATLDGKTYRGYLLIKFKS